MVLGNGNRDVLFNSSQQYAPFLSTCIYILLQVDSQFLMSPSPRRKNALYFFLISVKYLAQKY